MQVEQAIGFYRLALVEALTLLVFFLLAFGAITVAGRAIWAGLGVTESLLARIAAAIVLGSIAAGGTSGVIVTVLQPTVLSDVSGGADAARNQAILVFGVALAITIIAVIRLERYSRRRAGVAPADEEADWKVEPPATGRR
ncbi:MAG: hypothetical protein M3077_14790 [Candidatus Dormibacteraeota bacterium]|nr:hypothetical protein [Candidatus Dormibacteraeota bacterium]